MEKIKVLIVEDDMIIGREIQKTLKQLGYEVVDNVSSDLEALNALDNGSIDLVILDINIEGEKSGIEVAIIIKEKHNIPVVFLTALSDKITLDKAKEAHPYGYIVKPFTKEDINVAIELALHKFSLDKETQIEKQKFTQTLATLEDGILNLNINYQIELINHPAIALTGEIIHSDDDLLHISKVLEVYTMKNNKIPLSYLFNESIDVSGEEFTCFFPLKKIEQQLYIKTQRLFIENTLSGWILILSPSRFNTNQINEKVSSEQNIGSWLFAKKGKRYVKVNIFDLQWVEALDNYVVLNTSKDQFIIHCTLKKIEAILPTEDFIKIHRSFIVRLDKIEAWEDGYVLVSEKLLSVGKTFQNQVKEKLILL